MYTYICIHVHMYMYLEHSAHFHINFFSFVYIAYILRVFHLNQDFVIVYILDEHLL